jgi:hypothetical protein
MVSRTSLVAIVLVIGLGTMTTGQEPLEPQEREFTQCYMFKAQGRVWLSEVLVYLGMVGVPHSPPICLNAALCDRLGWLVRDVAVGKDVDPYTIGLPHLEDAANSMTLLGMRCKMRLLEANGEVADRRSSRDGQRYEVFEAKLDYAECVPRSWIKQWTQLDDALNEMVSVTLTAPGPQKRERLTEIVDRGSRAMNAMVGIVKAMEPFPPGADEVVLETPVVYLFKRQVMSQWQDRFMEYAARLRIQPKIPFPERQKDLRSETVRFEELFLESSSAQAFVDKIKKEWSADILVIPLVHSSKLHRTVPIGEVGILGDGELEVIRGEIKEHLDQVRRSQDESKTRQEESASRPEVKAEVVLQPVSADLMAEKLILSGLVVEKVLADPPKVDIRPGDIIIDYQRVYDLVMAGSDSSPQADPLKRIEQGGALYVLRGGSVITITLK